MARKGEDDYIGIEQDIPVPWSVGHCFRSDYDTFEP